MDKNTFIIVTWNNEKEIKTLIESLKKYAPNDSAIIVDNNSQDRTVQIAQSYNYEIEVIGLKENIGFAKANNLAVKKVITEYVTLINPDAILINDSIKFAYEELKTQDVGLVSGKLLNLDNTLQPSIFAFQRPTTLFIEQFGIGKILPNNLRTKLSPENSNYNEKKDVDWLLGAFLVMKTENYRLIEGFSTDYFLYAEDMDIAYKLKLNNLRRIYNPAIQVYHIGGTSENQDISQSKRSKLLLAFSIFAKKYNYKNNIKTLYFCYLTKAIIICPLSVIRRRYKNKFTDYIKSVKYLKELM